jgi:hypothetical protein
MANRLDALACRAERDKFFLASALADYARSERLGERELAAALGCAPDTLARLRLCRRPHGEVPRFRRDVEQIASRFGVVLEVLVRIVRHADAIEALKEGGASTHGTLAAARDRLDDEGGAGAPEDGASM